MTDTLTSLKTENEELKALVADLWDTFDEMIGYIEYMTAEIEEITAEEPEGSFNCLDFELE